MKRHHILLLLLNIPIILAVPFIFPPSQNNIEIGLSVLPKQRNNLLYLFVLAAILDSRRFNIALGVAAVLWFTFLAGWYLW